MMKQQKFIFSKNYLLIETTGDVEMRCQEGGNMNLTKGKYCFFKRDFVYRGDTTLIGLVHLTFNYENDVEVLVGEKWRVNLESLAEYMLDTARIEELEKRANKVEQSNKSLYSYTAQLRRRIDEIEDEIYEYDDDFIPYSKIEILKEQVNGNTDRISVLEEKTSILQTKTDTLREKDTELEKNIASNTNRIIPLEEDTTTLKNTTASLQDKDILLEKDITSNTDRIAVLEEKTSTLQDSTATTIRTATFNLSMYDTPSGISYAVFVGDWGLSRILDFKINCTCVGIKYGGTDGRDIVGFTSAKRTVPFIDNFNLSGYGEHNTIVRPLGGMNEYEHISEFVTDCGLLGYVDKNFVYIQQGVMWQQQSKQKEILHPYRANGGIPNALDGEILNATQGCLVFCLDGSMVTTETPIQATITYIGDKALTLTEAPIRLTTTTQRIMKTVNAGSTAKDYPYYCGWSKLNDYSFHKRTFKADSYLNNAYIDVQISNNSDDIPSCRLYLQKREEQSTTSTGITPILYTFVGCGMNDLKNTYAIMNGETKTGINAKVELLLRTDEDPKLALYLNAYTATKGETLTDDPVKTSIALDNGSQATVHMYGFTPSIQDL